MFRDNAHFFVLTSMMVGGALAGNACSEDSATDPSSVATGSPTGTGGSAAGSGGQGQGAGQGTGGNTTSAGGAGIGGAGGAVAEVKVAFWGDTGNGSAFIANLNLAKSEGADFVMHAGDFDYGEKPVPFWTKIDDVLGHDYPYLLAVGNHDDGAWVYPQPPGAYSYTGHMSEHLLTNGIVVDDPDHSDQKYSTEFMGLRIVVVGENGNNAEFAQFVDDELDPADTRWKICHWHKNQTAMQAGGKGNEMGWPLYEACRTNGAIIITGHEHSYSRTKTLTSIENRTVDASCSDPGQVCVGPGRSFVVVQGLGGVGIRDQLRCLPATTYPYDCNGEWAMIYANQQNAQYGTMFITFNVGGDPKKASAYFKTIDGDIIDQFEITKD